MKTANKSNSRTTPATGQQITARISDAMLEEINAICEEQHISQADALRWLMWHGVATAKELGSDEVMKMRRSFLDAYTTRGSGAAH